MSARLLLIDGHSVAYRAFFALPVENFATATGQHTNAVYGFIAMLINVIRDERPTHVAVAFDVSRHSFRTDQYPDYKANRASSPEEFKGQVALIKEALDALNIVHLEREGFEADDIIASLTTQLAGEDTEVLICTGDRDSMQLVTNQVTVLYPRKGVSDLARMTPAAVEEKYLVPPARYPELAALVGETSDNLPGVPGVGPKTAAKWIGAYDGLDNIIARAGQIPGKAGASLREHLDDVIRNRRLNALVTDLDLGVGLGDLERRDWDREATHTLFDVLEFRVLRDRLADLGPVLQDASGDGFEVSGAHLQPGELAAWLAEATGVVGLDFVGRWGKGTGDVTGVGFACASGRAAWVDVTELTPGDDQAFASWLADQDAPKAIHDAKGPMLACAARGWELRGVSCDTLLAAYLLRPDQRTFDLADLSLRYLRRELRASGTDPVADGQLTLDFGDEDQASAAMLRARAVIDLAETLEAELAAKNQLSLLRDLELPLTGVLARMEQAGIAVDLDRLDALRREFDDAVVAAEQAAYDVLGKQINLGSPKQLQGVLFDELGMPKTRRTKSGYTTDAEALTGLYQSTGHPFLGHLLAHRDAIKLRQTVDGLLAAVSDDGRIHTSYMQTVAATGRLSSTDPNLQNIPIRTPAGRRIREAFVVGVGYETLLTADYSQIEMRLMADASGDEGLIEAFRSGRDFHTAMAARVFGVAEDAVDPAQRAQIKAMNYGLAYGLSAYG
ncbi:MAG: DNA polymerase I, partial [Propionibacteriaceae bacterium]|nr:DNA polymerase I [Propionibacteriaceae bacterium]